MIRKGYLGVLALTLYVSLMQGQAVLDTICIDAAPSNLAVPYQPGYTYQWNVNGGQIISRPDSNDVLVDWGPSPGVFQVSVIRNLQGQSCPGDTSYALLYLQSPNRATGKGPTQVCRGELVMLESTVPGDFRWSTGQTVPQLSFTAQQDTSLYLVALNADCGNDTLWYYINVNDPPISAMNQLQDTLQLNTSVNMYFTGQGSNIEWYLNGGYAGSGSYVLMDFTQLGDNFITQVVTNGACTDTLRKSVFVDDLYTAFFPNAFTPNGDGVNDLWTFNGKGHASYTAQIYNRWGEMVHSWTDQSPVEGWDGTNQGVKSKGDVYVYKVEIKDLRGRMHYYVNQFTLVR